MIAWNLHSLITIKKHSLYGLHFSHTVHRIFCKAAVEITDLSDSGIKLRVAVAVLVHEPI